MSVQAPRALLITGAVGVGKTTVAGDVGQELAERGIPGAVIEERSARSRYEEAMGAPLTVVRLTAAREVVRERLRRRHEFDPQGLAWHLDRFDELTAILDTAQVADVELSVDETSHATAWAVLDVARI